MRYRGDMSAANPDARNHRSVKTVSTTVERSALMARVRHTGTGPELVVQGILRRHGLRFEITGVGLPGSPDLYDSRNMRAVFVHGCYWHRHPGCRASTTPKSNRQYWLPKFNENVARDHRKMRQLRALGYHVMVVWECQVKSTVGLPRLERRLLRFFGALERA